MFIGYNEDASGGNDPTKTTASRGPRERTLGKLAFQCGAALTQLIPNIGGPREAKRRLVASVVNSKLLYAASVWTNAPNIRAIQKKLFSAQKGVVLRTVSAYRPG